MPDPAPNSLDNEADLAAVALAGTTLGAHVIASCGGLTEPLLVLLRLSYKRGVRRQPFGER